VRDLNTRQKIGPIFRSQVADQLVDQPANLVEIELVFAAKGMEDLSLDLPCFRVPMAFGELKVDSVRAVLP